MKQVFRELKGIFAGIADAVIATDRDGRILFINPQAEALTGLEQADTEGKPFGTSIRFAKEQSRDPLENPIEAVLRNRSARNLPGGAMLIRHDGAQRAVEGSAAPVRDHDRETVGALLIFRDVTERTERERLVQEALVHAEHIFATVREPLIILDENLRVQSANRSFYRTFQVSREETEDRFIFELGNGQWNIPGLRELLERVLPQNEAFEAFEVEHEFPGIGFRSMVVNARRLPPWGGEDAKILLAIEDVTERRRAEEALRRNQERLQKALSIDTIGVLIFEEKTGTLVDANDTFLRQTGFTREDVENRELTWKKLTPPEYMEASRDQMRQLDASGRIGPYEKEYYRKDGSRSWMLFAGAKLDDGTVIEHCIDINHIKQMEQKLIDSERRYRRLFETARDGILIIDADSGKIIDANPFVADLLGYPREEFYGKELWELGLLQDKSESEKAFEELQRRDYVRYEHLPLKKRTGERAEVEFISNVYHVNGKRVIQCNVRDISERAILQRVQEHARDLATAGRRRDEFLAMLSHELRNPLAPVATAVSVLRLSDETPVQQEARAVIERQVAHLTHLVDDLLEVSRITSGRIRLRREKVPLSDVVENAMEMVRPLVAQRQHELTLSLPREPVWLDADAERMGQVVSNLLTNAVKYTDQGGTISVTARREGDEAVLKVADNGAGISSDLLPDIFNLFSQGKQPLARSQGGLGIGLAVVRTLVEMHGGAVEAHSDGPGKGSEFTVRLPVVESPRETAADEVRPEELAARQGERPLRVLIVDDNVDTAHMLARLVEALRLDARTAFTGTEALRVAREYQPDVVLLDIGLPGLDGYDVAQRVRGEPELRDVTLVAITGYGLETDRQRSREAGFDHHLTKPADFDRVTSILQIAAEAKSS